MTDSASAQERSWRLWAIVVVLAILVTAAVLGFVVLPVVQGNAAGDEFRTAPLWGVGQRAFFLHDGRTSDLLQAILAHSSSGSEAVNVIGNFQALTGAQKQDILNFLRSL